jgi:hypothetical protein
MQISRTSVILGLVALIAFGLYAGVNFICQHRADYPGDITFIGQPRHVFGATYWRVAMWRATNDTRPLPDVTLSIDGQPYALSAITMDTVTGLGGALMSAGLVDAEGNAFRYRFEGGRLTYFAFDAERRRRRGSKPPTTYQVQTITMALGDGPQFKFPITHRELVAWCGKPERAYLNFAQ